MFSVSVGRSGFMISLMTLRVQDAPPAPEITRAFTRMRRVFRILFPGLF